MAASRAATTPAAGPDPAQAAAHYLRPGTLSLAAQPPLALYVHLPWCLRKCPYCDFNSHGLVAPGTVAIASAVDAVRAAPAVPDESRYLDALCADLESALPLVWGRKVESMFIGGGTPSLFAPASIDRLLGDVRARLPLVPGCEITLEANPGTFEAGRFRGYARAGVTRLSIGVQSFDDASLARVGRVHDAAQAHAAIDEARAAFATFNIDLMYALPGQDLAALERDVDAALAHAPPHLSVYHLTIEPNTAFATRPPADLPDDDTAAAMLDAITARTAAHGLARYEVSAYARPGHQCRHNRNYWQFGDYLGIGAGAHGKLSFPHRVVRQVRWREPQAWMRAAMAGNAVSNAHEVARRDLPFEYMLNALRLVDGFAEPDYVARTGLPLSTIAPTLQAARERGLLQCEPGAAGGAHDSVGAVDAVDAASPRIWRPTPRGLDFLSDLQAMFLPAA